MKSNDLNHNEFSKRALIDQVYDLGNLTSAHDDDLYYDEDTKSIRLNLHQETRTIRSDEHNLLFNSIFITIYVLITVLSFVGNTIILIVILRRRRMRNVTNYFLANLTVANLIYTICAPIAFSIEIHGVWVYSDLACPLLPFFSTLSINVNTFTMIVASLERLIAIVFPFKCKLNKNKCAIIIVCVWIVASIASLPWVYLLKTVRVTEQVSDSLSYESRRKRYFLDTYHYVSNHSENEMKIHYKDFLEKFYNPANMTQSVSEVLTKVQDFLDKSIENLKTKINNLNMVRIESNEEFPQSANNLSFYETDLEVFGILREMVKETFSDLKRLELFRDDFLSLKSCSSVYNDIVLRIYFLFLCLVQYFLPLVVLCVTYAVIAYYVYIINSQIDLNINYKCHNNILSKNKKKVFLYFNFLNFKSSIYNFSIFSL